MKNMQHFEWIPADQALPDDGEVVIVTLKRRVNNDRNIATAYYSSYDRRWIGNIGRKEVIAWARIEPYKGN